jgi:23S rRNA (pseudouridine1915-N3)-methyltransferase
VKKIKIIVVDRTRSPFIKEGESHYFERIKNYANPKIFEVKPIKITKGKNSSDIIRQEGGSLLKTIHPSDYFFALDSSGKLYSSVGFAKSFGRLIEESASIAFVVGGPLGLSSEVLSSADEVLSLSRLTFTHEMTRLILLEQIYRAFTILRGEKYHKF